MKLSKRARFALGHDITLDELDRDPYPLFAPIGCSLDYLNASRSRGCPL